MSPGPFVRLYPWASSLPITGKDWVQMGNTPAGGVARLITSLVPAKMCPRCCCTNRPHLTKYTRTGSSPPATTLSSPATVTSGWMQQQPVDVECLTSSLPQSSLNASNQRPTEEMEGRGGLLRYAAGHASSSGP